MIAVFQNQEFLGGVPGEGLETVLCTDVSRDGMLGGVNEALYWDMEKRYPSIDVLASGGVSGLDDLINLKKLGLAGAIVGKAIYEGRIDVAQAIERLKHAS